MVSLFRMLVNEVKLTVDDFREKGAAGALRDAVLDTRDMASDAGKMLWNGIHTMVKDESKAQAFVRSDELPMRGDTVPLEFEDGRIIEVTVVLVDGVSTPPRLKVALPDVAEPLVVNVVLPSDASQESPVPEPLTVNSHSMHPEALAEAPRTAIITNLTEDWNATVQDFRDKGPVATIKDVALDAADIVGSTTATALRGVRSLTSPLMDLALGPTREAEAEDLGFIHGLKQEIQTTVQDIRERGPLPVLKDAAFDVVDMVGAGASVAVNGARSIAAPLLGAVRSAAASPEGGCLQQVVCPGRSAATPLESNDATVPEELID